MWYIPSGFDFQNKSNQVHIVIGMSFHEFQVLYGDHLNKYQFLSVYRTSKGL